MSKRLQGYSVAGMIEEHYVKVCFGLDSDCTKSATWAQLERNQV